MIHLVWIDLVPYRDVGPVSGVGLLLSGTAILLDRDGAQVVHAQYSFPERMSAQKHSGGQRERWL